MAARDRSGPFVAFLVAAVLVILGAAAYLLYTANFPTDRMKVALALPARPTAPAPQPLPAPLPRPLG